MFMKKRLVLGVLLVTIVCMAAMAQDAPSSGPVYVSEPVVPTISPVVRDLPESLLGREYYGLEMKRREDYGFIPITYPVEPRVDPLLRLQRAEASFVSESFSTLIHLYAGQTSIASPPDATGDVGLNHFLQAVNQSVSTVQVLNKGTGAIMKTFTLQSLASGSPCNSGYCDPMVLYDRMADRWMISEFPSSGGHLCVYVSTTGDPTGTWYAYTFSNVETSTPDYPKYGVWPQNGNGGSYLVGINAGASGKRDVVALDRAKMLAGQPATFQKFSVTAMPNSGFQLVLPATVQGMTPPPDGAPALFMRPRDRAQQDGVTNKTYDLLEMWALSVDWATPANSTLTVLPSVQISPYDMTLCGMGTTWNCMPQPGTTQKIDPIREPIHFPLQYRNFGDRETLVGCYVTDVDGTDHAALRWFEVRKTGGGNWTLFQEGVVGGEANVHRSVGSAAMDGSGNIAIGYTRTGTASPYYPSAYFKGRLSTDPAGTMPQGEYVIVDATASKTDNERWGDYAGIGVDPTDDCTFWFTTEYGGSGQTKVAAFKFDACGCTPPGVPTIGSATTPANNQIQVTWTAGSPAGTTYKIYRSVGACPGGTFTLLASGLTGSPYTDITVSAGTTYSYKVTAVDSTGTCESAQSGCVSATATGPTYSISGTVSGAVTSGVTMNLTGAATASTTTGTGGTYAFSGLGNGSYTVTPSLSGYTFSPTSTPVTISGANVTGINFVSSVPPSGVVNGDFETGSLSSWTAGTGTGTIAPTASTAQKHGGTYSAYLLGNNTAGSATTCTLYQNVAVPAGGGTLSFWYYAQNNDTVSYDWQEMDICNTSGTVLASPLAKGVYNQKAWTQVTYNMAAYAGTTIRLLFTVRDDGYADSTVTYMYVDDVIINPSGATYSISGTVSGATASGVSMALTGAATANTTTDASGNYTFSGLNNGSYTVTPSKSGYTFSPVNIAVTISGANQTGKNFTATATTTYSISGTITKSTGGALSGVAVSCTGASATTDASGNYTLSGLANGTYTVTPTLAGYTFSPVNQSVTISGANVTGKNFTGTASGPVTLFTNGFETSTGWAQVDTSGTTGTWSLVTSGTYPTCSVHGGSYMAKFNSYNATSGNATRYYRTSGFAVASTYTTVTWTFWMYHDTGYSTRADKIQPQVSTNGSTWTSVGSAINRYDGSTGWKQHTVSITSYKGSTVYLGFLATSAYGNNIFLDDALVVGQ